MEENLKVTARIINYANINAKKYLYEYRNPKTNKLHRLDGPALKCKCVRDGNISWYYEWYKNGRLHREDGPALQSTYLGDSWYLNGKKYSQEEFKLRLLFNIL